MGMTMWPLDLVLGLLAGLTAAAALSLAGLTPGGMATAIVCASGCAILVPLAAVQAWRARRAG